MFLLASLSFAVSQHVIIVLDASSRARVFAVSQHDIIVLDGPLLASLSFAVSQQACYNNPRCFFWPEFLLSIIALHVDVSSG